MANFSLNAHWKETPPGGNTQTFSAWTCDNCKKPIVGPWNGNAADLPNPFQPKHVPDPTYEHVPESIARDAIEAHRCFAVEAYRAAAAMARRAIQSTAFEKGAPDKKLVEQIDWLSENSVLPDLMKDLAHQIRAWGKDGAHPDKDGLETIDKHEAEATLQFLEEFLRYTYEMPGRLEAIRTRPPIETGD